MKRILVIALLAFGALAAPAAAHGGDRTLDRYAADTWRSFDMLTDRGTGLPSDNVSATGERSHYTSPTNIGAYLWSTVAARDLKLISGREATARMRRTLDTVSRLERGPGGQFFNWYDPRTGERLTTWPVDGNKVYPFLSSVDNGWLGAALIMVQNADPKLRREARAIEASMNWGFYYDPALGQLYGGAWTEKPEGCSQEQVVDGKTVYYTCHRYGTLNTEPRIASYLGIAQGSIPPEHYFRMFRTMPDQGCDYGWQEQKPQGVTRNYLGVDVFEGHYSYAGMNLVPAWGGSMFEALMVPLLVPEEQWGRQSWGVNHPLFVRAQIHHGLQEAKYGYWGFSPSNNPEGGYREYGVDAIGMDGPGYTSDQERTAVDLGYEGCRPAQPLPTAYGHGVVTPHASFLALDFAPREALDNLARLRRNFDVYGRGGFYDAIDVKSGKASKYYLALDQGMVMASLANKLGHDRLQRYLAPRLERRSSRCSPWRSSRQGRATDEPAGARADWEARIGRRSETGEAARERRLPPPGNLRADSGAGQVTLRWDPVEGAIGYLPHRAPSPDGPWTPVDHGGMDVLTHPGPAYADTTGEPGLECCYAVASVAGEEDGPGELSAPVAARPSVEPAAPLRASRTPRATTSRSTGCGG